MGSSAPTRRSCLLFSIGFIASLGCLRGQAQTLLPVRLLVLRKPGISITNECLAPCIRGRVYDVSNVTGFELGQLVLPAIKQAHPICDIVERPFQNNKPNVSSIPRGVYNAAIREDRTKSWMDTPEKRWRIELQGVPRRTAIQLHYGRDVNWSEGCLIVGKSVSREDDLTSAAYCSLEDAERAIADLKATVTSPGRNAADIKVAVADDLGLFPNVRGSMTCP